MAKKKKTDDVKDAIMGEEDGQILNAQQLKFEKVISTGSTLLDLAISGGRVRGGGIPGGIIAEVFGASQVGKSAILSECGASAITNGGQVRFDDPEARLDKEYSRIYGLELNAEDYNRPNTVTEVFQNIREWEPKSNDVINVSCEDSLAALSTNLEMDNDDGDKMGMRRAKEFSEGFRKTARIIANNNWLILCSNQERDGANGIVTPGGRAIPYYSSLRIRLTPAFKGKYVTKSATITSEVNGKTKKKVVEKTIGIKTVCTIKKSIDDPFRQAEIYIIFGHGIDDVRGNLQYIKDMTNAQTYIMPDESEKSIVSMDNAVKYIEENNLEEQLRENTIDLWEQIEAKFKIKRKGKKRR